MRSCRRSRTALELIKSVYHSVDFIRTVSMKVFIGKVKGSCITSVGKVAESETTVRNVKFIISQNC